MDQIAYRAGYKYQLAEDYTVSVPITPGAEINTRFLRLTTAGALTIRADYAWDGPSGPTVDTRSVMRAALIHDALYQLIRQRTLDPVLWRLAVDRIFLDAMLQDGVFPPRAQLWYRGVRIFGEPDTDPEAERPLIWAPSGLAAGPAGPQR